MKQFFDKVFLIVLDSLGVGEAPDASLYGDAGANTLRAVCRSPALRVPFLTSLGLFNIDGIGCGEAVPYPQGCFGKAAELSVGKDTTTGHWEMAGLVSRKKMPVFPNGFPDWIIKRLEAATGRRVVCNRPYSGTDVIKDYGREQLESGALIVYTSADSVLQIAAHERVVARDELYQICRVARELMTGEFAVGRIIARPFAGEYPDFYRTADRRDFSLEPPAATLTDLVSDAALECVGVGKIGDIFCGRGLTRDIHTASNSEGMDLTCKLAKETFKGLVFVNLVDFDTKYGHRNDVDGYARALTEFDLRLAELAGLVGPDDAIVLTADHGCDPSTAGTDHTREFVPVLAFGNKLMKGINLGVRRSFADVGASVAELLGLESSGGQSFAAEIVKED